MHTHNPILVKVKPEHINRGRRCDQRACPAALAMQDAGFTDVRVDHGMIRSRLGAREVFLNISAEDPGASVQHHPLSRAVWEWDGGGAWSEHPRARAFEV